ncbi:hypothetical protein AGMMS4952_12900 [Spirochaetia bacterium]|nr:hypothetical protein AGMMS4952_12900 [Spirochaetia bacterium]
MVKGAWIINLRTMYCKNWVNGIGVVFHPDENGRLVGKLMPLPTALSGELNEKIPVERERMAYIYRMWQRATVIFYRAWSRNLFRNPEEGKNRKVFPPYPRSAPPILPE